MTDAGCAVKNNKELPQTAGEYTLDSLVMHLRTCHKMSLNKIIHSLMAVVKAILIKMKCFNSKLIPEHGLLRSLDL